MIQIYFYTILSLLLILLGYKLVLLIWKHRLIIQLYRSIMLKIKLGAGKFNFEEHNFGD